MVLTGQSQHMPDIIDRVNFASPEDQSIDWKMAFFDIKIITQNVKSSLEKQALEKQTPIPAITSKYT